MSLAHLEDLRVWAGIISKKESLYVRMQRTCDSEGASQAVAGWSGRQCGIWSAACLIH
jgi:hypothetical protein